ncbi:ECF transporter S component [Radiobacillus sp. PE A8.2]|uniref:ECF transporter S component n=1 Tax=Radiobacillus sp. PE A8.2 TaxID=3380349 RepID=UPI003890E10D
MNVYKLTVIALLSAVAVVGRIAFKDLPGFQPVTSLIIICGYFLGPIAAAILAVLTTFLSNMTLGLGIWTLAQIVAWACIGVTSGLIGKVHWKKPLIVLTIFAVLSGYVFGLFMSIPNYLIAGKFFPYYLVGIPHDTNHAIGNGIFMVVLFPVLSRILIKYQKNWKKPRNTN